MGWRDGRGTHGLWIRAVEDTVRKGQRERGWRKKHETRVKERGKEHDVLIISYPIYPDTSEEKYTAPAVLVFSRNISSP